MLAYVGNVAIGIDITVNALLGGRRYQTISSRIGESIKAGGWAAHVPWPRPLREHWLSSDHMAHV